MVTSNMFQLQPVVLASALGLISTSVAQQFPPPVTYDTVIKSPVDPNIIISYKQPDPGTCKTALSTQEQYSGYVNIPPSTLAPYQQDYPINTFFWFFEARTNPETAPLTIWLNGGPGSSSMIGLFQELGPCEVVQLPNGTYGTQPRLWGWDHSSNLLFIDQPTQTGFSYDELVNASVDLGYQYPYELESRMEPQPVPLDVPEWRFLNGTFASGHDSSTESTAKIAANACWHILQGFLSAFPQYNPGSHPERRTVEPAGIHLFTESYGGIYGPTFADFFEDQNVRRGKGFIPSSALDIRLSSVGIVNGVVDALSQTVAALNYTHSNNYGIQELDDRDFDDATSAITSPGGCQDLLTQCRHKSRRTDPKGAGLDEETNTLCSQANAACLNIEYKVYARMKMNVYDIRVSPESGPGASYQEYLNYPEVLKSIGAPVNYTQSSSAVYNAFNSTGDAALGTQLQALADLLTRGIRVALIYGDADVICNWYGGQNVSLELASLVPAYKTKFINAGYADIFVNESYIGGQVRQFGNLSFSRIYDAGHLVPYYQPETALTVFTRIIQGDDIGMGREIDPAVFGTLGSNESVRNNKKPENGFKTSCWLRDPDTCTTAQRHQINDNKGFVQNGVWSREEKYDCHSESNSTSFTSSKPATGVYAATTIPQSISAASARLQLRGILPISPSIPGDAAAKAHTMLIGLIAGLAAVGGLSLLLIVGVVLFLIARRQSKEEKPPSRQSTPTQGPTSEPERRPSIVQRVMRAITRKDPNPITPRTDIEQPEVLAKQDLEPELEKTPGIVERIRRARTRKNSVPAVPPTIVEKPETAPTTRSNSEVTVATRTNSEQPETMQSTRKTSIASVLADAEQAHTETVPESEPEPERKPNIVERIRRATTRKESGPVVPPAIDEDAPTSEIPSRVSTAVQPSEKSRAASLAVVDPVPEPIPNPSRRASAAPEKKEDGVSNPPSRTATVPPPSRSTTVGVPSRTSTQALQDSSSKEPEEKAPTPPSRVATLPPPSRAPSSVAPSRTTTQPMKEEDEEPTPPPRIATLPPPSRATTAGAPSRTTTQPQ